jgi:hypothetical protein
MLNVINQNELFKELNEAGNIEMPDTSFLSLPKLINPHLGSCKVILFCDKKEEGLCLALQDKINLKSIQNQPQQEYIDFSQFVQVTRDYMLASGFKDDNTGVFDLIHSKKLEDEKDLDNQLLEEFNLTWYPLSDVKQLLSPIEMSFIDRMNKPATFTIAK